MDYFEKSLTTPQMINGMPISIGVKKIPMMMSTTPPAFPP